jgi:hypothetical protein
MGTRCARAGVIGRIDGGDPSLAAVAGVGQTGLGLRRHAHRWGVAKSVPLRPPGHRRPPRSPGPLGCRSSPGYPPPACDVGATWSRPCRPSPRSWSASARVTAPRGHRPPTVPLVPRGTHAVHEPSELAAHAMAAVNRCTAARGPPCCWQPYVDARPADVGRPPRGIPARCPVRPPFCRPGAD